MQSVLAVLAGFVTMTVIVIVSTVILARGMMASGQGGMADARRLPPGYLMANLFSSAFAALAGGYLTATLADSAPLLHGVALAIVMILMSAISMRQTAGRQPRWYALTIMLVMPLIAVGGAFLQTVVNGAL